MQSRFKKIKGDEKMNLVQCDYCKQYVPREEINNLETQGMFGGNSMKKICKSCVKENNDKHFKY